MTPAPVSLTPGSKSSEHFLTIIAVVAGALAVLGGVALSVFGKAELLGLAKGLIEGGLWLVGLMPAAYGVLRTVLKYRDLAKKLEPEANSAAALVPGPTGDALRHALALIEKLIDALPDSPAITAATLPAATALGSAMRTPVAPPGSPSSAGGV